MYDLNFELPTPQAWMEDAACVGQPPDLWFPKASESGAAAKEVCATCPVAGECIDYAMSDTNSYMYGIYGGLGGKLRRELRAEREAA